MGEVLAIAEDFRKLDSERLVFLAQSCARTGNMNVAIGAILVLHERKATDLLELVIPGIEIEN